MRVTDSKEEDAVPSCHRLRSKDTLETVVVRYGEGIWQEADGQWPVLNWATVMHCLLVQPNLQCVCGLVSPMKVRCVAECGSRL